MTIQSPIARQQFARRLREFRVARGFKTARSLALALDIDENRYTRYERAEVEPDIKLIQQICKTLNLSPNDLLGSPGALPLPSVHASGGARAAGFGEAERAPFDLPVAQRDRTAWLLACAVADLQEKTSAAPAECGSRLATLQRAARLFADLEKRPYAAMSDMLLDPAVAQAPPKDARRIETLIEALTSIADR